MTHTAMQVSPRFQPEARAAEEGPIVVAAKAFEGGDAPLAMARWLARREDRELHVVSVMERGNDAFSLAAGIPPLPVQFYEDERVSIETRIRAGMEQQHGELVRYRVDVLEGPSAQCIVELAHDRGARAIVIGTGKHDSVGRFVYGERAMQITRLADRPVLVVPRVAVAGPVRHAMIAVDFTAASLRAATAALPMIQRGGRLTLVTVRPAVNPVEPRAAARANERQVASEDSFRRFLKLLAPTPDLTVETRVLWGDPVNALDEFARLCNVGLIACGRRRNHSLVERLFVGTVSSGLIRRASCPVLVVPEESDIAAERVAGMLTGIDSWTRAEWPDRIAAFHARNRDRRVRVSVESNDTQHRGVVAQGYSLRATSYDPVTSQFLLQIDDDTPSANVMSLRFNAVTAVTMFADTDGNDLRLRVESDTGCGTITVAAAELP